MKILLFGATGMVGQHIIDSAIAHGHSVRAFGRNVYEKLPTERPNLELFKGYLFTDSDIRKAMKGVDVVLSAIGGPMEAGNFTRSLGMKKIVAGMEKRSKKRIIGIGGLGILDKIIDEETGQTDFIFRTPDFPKQYKMVSEEHLKAFEHLQESKLDWTFVCPPNIINAEASGDYNVNKNFPAEGKFEINAGDIAEFMMKELEENAFIHCRVGIAAKDSAS
ncbi:MAG: NAD(P)H-binding protein [Saprospiraceae bacterium]